MADLSFKKCLKCGKPYDGKHFVLHDNDEFEHGECASVPKSGEEPSPVKKTGEVAKKHR